jgi:hypothetical protein
MIFVNTNIDSGVSRLVRWIWLPVQGEDKLLKWILSDGCHYSSDDGGQFLLCISILRTIRLDLFVPFPPPRMWGLKDV